MGKIKHKIIEEQDRRFICECPNLPSERVIVGYCSRDKGFWMCSVCGKSLGKDRETLRKLM